MTQDTNDTDGTASGDTPAKRMGRRSAEESRKTKRRLLGVAIAEFAEKGVHEASLDEIAERAGVTKGAIYSHFRSREHLLVEACRIELDSFAVLKVSETAVTLDDFINGVARRLLAPENTRARILLSELHSSARRSELIAELIAERRAHFVEIVNRLVPSETESPETVAMVLNVLLNGLSYLDLYRPSVEPDEVIAVVNKLVAPLVPAGNA